MKKITGIFITLLFLLPSCNLIPNNSNKDNKKDKIETINHYLEIVDKTNNGFSKKVIKGIELKLTSVDYIMSKDKTIMPIQHFEKVNKERLDSNFFNIHKFYNIKNINPNNIPENNSVKVKLIFSILDDHHMKVDIAIYCKDTRPEWWQCGHPGIFEYPSEADIKKGKDTFTTDELVEKISDLILKLTYINKGA